MFRYFARRPNPVAAALMAKMRIAPADRPRVKMECLRLLATLRLDPARQGLIRDFADAYLRLSAAEMRVYDQALQSIDPPEREAVMKISNQWEEIGEARGEARGGTNVLLAMLRRRFGEVPKPTAERIGALPAADLPELAAAVFDFTSPADVEAWLAARR